MLCSEVLPWLGYGPVVGFVCLLVMAQSARHDAPNADIDWSAEMMDCLQRWAERKNKTRPRLTVDPIESQTVKTSATSESRSPFYRGFGRTFAQSVVSSASIGSVGVLKKFKRPPSCNYLVYVDGVRVDFFYLHGKACAERGRYGPLLGLACLLVPRGALRSAHVHHQLRW